MPDETFNCECIECGYKMESEEHCKDLKCPECGGQMRREERPGPGQDKINTEGKSMSRIEIRGVIVPSEYDTGWTQEYIEKGIITPESYFRRALAEAAVDKPLDVYINSPGGSVFAAYEMVNALREWRMTSKQPINISLGAMVASAASMITIFIGSAVRAHRNSKMMFHGASSFIDGGQGAMKDEAELLGKINAEIQQTLISKYNMSSDVIGEWFAEGRMGWLTADEMVKAGIASEVITEDSEEIKFDSASIDAIGAKGLDIAALLETKEEDSDGTRTPGKDGEEDTKSETDKPDKEDTGSSDAEGNESTDEVKAAHDLGITEGQTAAQTEYADQLAAIAEKMSELQAKHDTLDALQRKTQGERDSARAQIEKQGTSIADLTEKLERLLTGGLKFSPSIATWADALNACDGDYDKARQQYPDIYKAGREEARANRK